MEVLGSRIVEEMGDGYEVQIGRATWDEDATSVRFRYPDKNGRTSRASPEVPIELLAPMIELALSYAKISNPLS
jgi:hypothetical protein